MASRSIQRVEGLLLTNDGVRLMTKRDVDRVRKGQIKPGKTGNWRWSKKRKDQQPGSFAKKPDGSK